MSEGDLVQRAQEHGHGPDHDYEDGSPHLQHRELHAWIVEELRSVIDGAAVDTRRPRVLEVGAGHGTFTTDLLAAGADVVVTEMSAASADALRERFAATPEVEVVHDPGGELSVDGDFDVIVYLSVLHHIPDYLTAVDGAVERLRPGGALVSFQDPLWYPRRSRWGRSAASAVYLSWRVGRGDLIRGLVATVRRARGAHDERELSDMVEYHVVRDGVDELAVQELLGRRFDDVRLIRYWSTQSSRGQRWGRRWLPPNTFGLVARRLRPAERRA